MTWLELIVVAVALVALALLGVAAIGAVMDPDNQL